MGGGASGALAAIHLLRHARARAMPLEVTLIDRDGRHALGQAYSTTDPHHLLNTTADKMSALDGDHGHLLRWARDRGLEVTGSDYLPRSVYGRYLREVLSAVENPPAQVLRRVTGTVIALERPHGVSVRLLDGRRIDADAAVLALGNRPPAAPPRVVEGTGARYVADPWKTGALDRVCDGAPVLVLGTGLTMVDVAVTVTGAHPKAVVYALSRHALLPRPHPHPLPPPVTVPLPSGPLTVAGLLRAVRLAVGERGGEWCGVVDGLRPQAQALWTRLSPEERRRFLRLVARYWEVHRHRIPPATAARIAELRAQGQLRVLRGRLVRASATAPGRLRVDVEADGTAAELDVGWLVNATGPGADLTADPLVAALVTGGTARPDAVGLGLEADSRGVLLDGDDRPNARIFALGPLLRGSLYETTAVPEIRAQAAALAPRLIEAIASPVLLVPRPSR
ncbi:hypothetical protein GCM10017673_11530 [Streptosporangium violaceochromogenes]|nr:hypothetical protein GCM10017673_11530 [Streptosporangium violaceochromogenes]